MRGGGGPLSQANAAVQLVVACSASIAGARIVSVFKWVVLICLVSRATVLQTWPGHDHILQLKDGTSPLSKHRKHCNPPNPEYSARYHLFTHTQFYRG